MGLGFIFIVIPITIILLVAWVWSEKQIFGKGILVLWGGLILLVILSSISHYFTKNIELTKEDYYGSYIIDRKRLRGEQTDWQYNHYRFTISKNDIFTLYETDDDNRIHIFNGKISTTTPYSSARLIIKADSVNHHFFDSNPTTYRSGKKFYLVFKSTKFSNMFFKKGEWKPID